MNRSSLQIQTEMISLNNSELRGITVIFGANLQQKIPSKMEVALRCKLLTLFKLFVNAYIVYTTHTTYTAYTAYTVYTV